MHVGGGRAGGGVVGPRGQERDHVVISDGLHRGYRLGQWAVGPNEPAARSRQAPCPPGPAPPGRAPPPGTTARTCAPRSRPAPSRAACTARSWLHGLGGERSSLTPPLLRGTARPPGRPSWGPPRGSGFRVASARGDVVAVPAATQGNRGRQLDKRASRAAAMSGPEPTTFRTRPPADTRSPRRRRWRCPRAEYVGMLLIGVARACHHAPFGLKEVDLFALDRVFRVALGGDHHGHRGAGPPPGPGAARRRPGRRPRRRAAAAPAGCRAGRAPPASPGRRSGR